MRWLRFALWPAGLAFGVAAEWAGRPDLIVLDAAAGFALVFLGLVAWSRRPGSRAGPIMSPVGLAWFLGTLWPPAVFLHRGPLAQLLISYPGGRLSSRLQRVGAGAAYAYAAADVVAGSSYATIIFALGLVALSARRYVGATGTERRARLASLTAAEHSLAVVDSLYRLAGSTAIFQSSLLERCWRDVHTAAQHLQVQHGRWETAGRVLFGLEPASPII